MTRPRPAGARRPSPALALVLAVAGLAAAVLGSHSAYPGELAALALVLTAVACAVAGALWMRQKTTDRLADLRQQQHLLLRLSPNWVWQTDAEHRLVRLQPPQDAPSSAWAAGSFGGALLWERFSDSVGALAARMQVHAELPETHVDDAGGNGSRWLLRGLPQHDSQGRFCGYFGVAAPGPTPAGAGAASASTPCATSDAVPAQAASLAAEHAAFVYTVSHDLRAPLRVIDGFGRILKEDYGAALDRIGNDHLDRMAAAAARMNQMLDALLALSELSVRPLQRLPVDLSQLAQHAFDDLRHADPQRRASLQVQPGLTAVGDPALLRIVLDNLLGNAWKYSAQRDAAEIAFEQQHIDGREVFVVRDNGTGFDMRFAERLFGAFQRLHSASEFPGHGVGLASVRRIVQRHGGQVWAESAVGEGARFFFTLGG